MFLIPVVIILLLLFCIALLFHNAMFKKRFTHDPDIELYKEEDFQLNSVKYSVKIKKETINGKFYFKENYKKDKLIVVCHGMFSSHLSYMQDIGYLCNRGYKVFGFDYVGTSSSTGKSLVGFGSSIRSLDYVIKTLLKEDEFKNIDLYVYGHSWGGHAVTNITKFEPRIKGVIALAPALSFEDVIKGLVPKFMYPMIPFLSLIEKIKLGRYGSCKAHKSFKKYQGKVLVIHSKDDHMVKYNLTTLKLEKRYPNFKYLILNDRKHNPVYTVEAVNKMDAYNLKSRSLSEQEKLELKKQTNFLEFGELDFEILENIVHFIEQ